MKYNFFKSTILLILGAFITKVLGMLIKIFIARIIGTKGLGMYMLIFPTFILLINLSNFSLPLALSKLISEDKRNNKKLFFSILPLMIIINIILMIIVILIAPFIGNNLLHNKDIIISIKCMSLVLPFTSISSICRSYFFGKEKILPHVLSNIIEDLVRLLIIIIYLPKILPLGTKYTVLFLILINIISEFMSTIILLLFIPKNITIKKEDLIPNKNYLKDSLKICIPNTTSKLIGSIGFFLEPIILTKTLLNNNYSINYITTEYGIISGYVIPLILLPSFITLAISQRLLPSISRDYSNNNINSIKKKINISILLSLIIGIPTTIILELYPNILLRIIYHTNKGINYIRILTPFCLLSYIQSPLQVVLDSINKSKINLYSMLISTITRSISLILLSNLNIGIYSLIISIILNIIITTFYQIKKVRQCLT